MEQDAKKLKEEAQKKEAAAKANEEAAKAAETAKQEENGIGFQQETRRNAEKDGQTSGGK